MTNYLKIAAGVINQTPLDWAGNRTRLIDAINQARDAGASVLCLPELCITGYNCEDAFFSADVVRRGIASLRAIQPHTRGMIISLGLPLRFNNALFNASALLCDGQILGFVAKQNLAGDGIHYEPRWFKPWHHGAVAEIEIDGQQLPIGDVLFDIGGVRYGFEICEDAWVVRRPGGELALDGVDVILNPSASHFAFGKIETRKRLVLEGSRTFGVSYVYSNLLGNEAGRAIYDGGALIASCGTLLAAGSRFSFRDLEITTATVDIGAARSQRVRTNSFRPNLTSETRVVRAAYEYPDVELQQPTIALADWEIADSIKEEEFARAEALALFDYMRKSRSNGFVISLSGGADSSSLACLIAIMAKFALDQLAADGVVARLSYLRDIADHVNSPAALVGRLLACAYQSTRNSGEVTRSAARIVAESINARFIEFDVDSLVRDYSGMVARGIGRELDWKTDDIAMQNIQARVRSPSVWMLANLSGALLLSTSNRSEAAVGYATMDGDTSGGLSPLAGIDKNYLRFWLQWLEARGPAGIGAMPAIRAVNVQAPTAELRPPTAHQTDEADLMPYDLLDAIEKAAIRDKLSPVQVFDRMRVEFPAIEVKDLGIWVERFFRLFARNQWKRQRYAPSFHLDDANLDPKTWCRFPILSGGFEEELGELREHVNR